MGVYDEIKAERARQDDRWGGPEHDDTHDLEDWQILVERRVEMARHQAYGPTGMVDRAGTDWRKRMLQSAALAVACVEWFDRTQTDSKP